MGQAFCGQCGTGLAPGETTTPGAGPAESPATGAGLEERKLATVLFADVVGFTSLADRMDPEAVTRLVDAAFKRLSEVVADHGGTVDKYMGDSVMAVFGVPVAHDDDAERAVAAGLAMRELGGDLAFSIGINTGDVMAASVGRAGDFTVIGDTVNVAARLEKVATAGEVLCGRLTADLARMGAVFRERKPVLLKGKREPVEVWEAVSMKHVEDMSSEDGALDGDPPLVGREDEFAFLESQWRRVCRDGRAHVVLLCGDAGSGKTRLLRELARSSEAEGNVVRVSYPGYGSMGGPRVAAEIVRQLGPSEDAEVNARVESTGGGIDPSLLEVDPAGLRQEQVWGFRRLLHEKSRARPLLVVIDDMHRSGDYSLELLSELAARVDDVPLMTVLSGRTDPPDWLSRFQTATRLPLGALSRGDARALAEAFAGDSALGAEALTFIVERANGNPLYLRELVTMTVERPLFGAGDDQTDPGGSRVPAQASLPATLQALVAARLDSLDAASKAVVQHVAVIGEPASAEQIGTLGSVDALSSLRTLVELGLLKQGDDGRYDMVDPLLREVAYETLPRVTRGELHRRLARASSGTEDRARHLDRAAGYLADDETARSEAADALGQAGAELIEASRHLDGIRLLERAVARGCTRPESLLLLARTQAVCGFTEEALGTLGMIADDPDDPTIGIERDHTAANAKVFSEPAWALPRLVDAAKRWHELGNRSKEAWATANSGVAYFYLTRMEEAAAALERAFDLFTEIDDRNGVVATTSFLCLARPTDKRVPEWLAEALEYAEKAGDKSREMTVLTTLSWHKFFREFCGNAGEQAGARACARRMAELAEELGANDLAIHGWSLLAVMYRLTGELGEAAQCVSALERHGKTKRTHELWFAWAASFAVTVAGGAWGVTPPFPPDDSPDPVTAMARLVIEGELALSGRAPEAVARYERSAHHPDLGPISELAGLFYAVALVLAGRPADALPLAERTVRAAEALEAHPALVAAHAVRAEILGPEELATLGPLRSHPGGLSEILLTRAHAVLGTPDASAALREAATMLGMPGLLAGF